MIWSLGELDGSALALVAVPTRSGDIPVTVHMACRDPPGAFGAFLSPVDLVRFAIVSYINKKQ